MRGISSLPPPPPEAAAESLANPPQAAGPPAPKKAVFGVFNGRSFTPTEAIDIHALDKDQWLDEFNRVVP
jgi:hypothetical protein